MIPLHDDNPTDTKPVVTVSLIGACIVVFLWQLSLGGNGGQQAVYALGFIPALLFEGRELSPDIALLPPSATFITSMFLHGGWMHLIGNMLYLWIFGNNIEDAMGHGRFIVFYGICGIAAALAQGFQDTSSVIPMIGASGAISGVLGAYLLLYPKAKVLVLVPLGIIITTLRLPALYVLGFWFVLQFLSGAVAASAESGGGGVAWWAHIGGFVAGMALVYPFRRQPRAARVKGPWG